MSHTDEDEKRTHPQDEDERRLEKEPNREFMSFDTQSNLSPNEDTSDLLRNAMNPLESRTAKATNIPQQENVGNDEKRESGEITNKPGEDGFINIETEDA